MVSSVNLDMDVLRTFVTGFELGSFARAAERLGRSQSAVSTQLRKLEEQIGQPLVQKAGRNLALTDAGENLLGYAKRILDLNDEAVGRLRGPDLEGWVRLGLPQDFAETWLPAVLGRFARAHPRIRVEIRVEPNAYLLERVMKGELDLALAWGSGQSAPHAAHILDLPATWIGPPDWHGMADLGGDPLPLIAFEPPCIFREMSIKALDAAGIAWRLAFTSPSLSGLWAAVEAGFGVTLRTAVALPERVCVLDPAQSGLPRLPNISLALHAAEANPAEAVTQLAEILQATIAERTERGRSHKL